MMTQAIQDTLLPVVLFLFYFFIFSRFVSYAHNGFSSDLSSNLDVHDSGFSDLPDVDENKGEDVNEDEIELERLTVKELRSLASSYGLKIKSKARKSEIIQMLRNVT